MSENNSLQFVITNLENLFSKFNRKYFNSELQKPIITVSPDSTSGAYGWCTSWKAWQEKDSSNEKDENKGYYEINMCAEYLVRPFLETCGTLIHEMVHLLNCQNEVQDTSRSGKYHNKKFKEIAEQHGLYVEKDSKYGYCITKLTDDTKYWIEQSCKDENNFILFRNKQLKSLVAKKQSTRKYVCPECGVIVRATKEVRIICADCDVELVEKF